MSKATFPYVRISSVSVFRPYSFFGHFHVHAFCPYNPALSVGPNLTNDTNNDNNKQGKRDLLEHLVLKLVIYIAELLCRVRIFQRNASLHSSSDQ